MITVDATNLPRLMSCNGSRLMTADPVLAEHDDTIRNEGNAVHWLASTVFSGKQTVDEMIDRKAQNGVYITAEMADHVREYLDELQVSPRPADWQEMETVTSFHGANWQINGRADCAALWHTALFIDDFKYGYSIVEPERNWTLIAHAIGICINRQITPEWIVFRIHQPRAQHRDGRVREWRISYSALMILYAEINATLSQPTNELRTGQHCYKCPAFASCPARQDAELNGIETAGIAYNAHIENYELSARMDQINRAMQLLKQSQKAYEELALHRIKSGQPIANYAAANELANRSWKDGVTPEFMEVLTGKDLTKPALISPRQAEQAGVNPLVVAALSERRQKGVELVRVDANKKASKMFGDKQQ